MGKYTIQTPDGETWDIEGPDNATDEEIIAFAQGELAKKKPGNAYPTPVINRRSAGEQLVDSAKQTGAGLIEGAASLIDIPANALGSLLSMGSNALGLPDWVSESLADPITIGGAAEKVVPRSDDAGLSMVRAMSQGLGGAASGLGLGRLLSMFGGTPLTQRVGTVLAEQPGAQSAAGTTAAIAAEGARQGGAPLPIQVLTGIAAGGVTPSAMRATGGAVEAGVNRFVTDEGIRQAAARLIEKNATNSLGRLVEMIDLAPPMQRSGANPTLAEVTLDPGLAGLQRTLGNSTVMGGATINSAINRNAQLRGAAANEALGPGDPTALVTTADARARLLERQADLARQSIGPDIAPDAAGEAARARLSDNYRGAKARTAEAYDAPVLQEDPPVRLRPLERLDVEVPTYPEQPDIAGFQQDATKGARNRLPQKPQSLLQFVRSMGGINPQSSGVGDMLHAGVNARSQPGLINRNGRDLDELRELAAEAGFLPEDSAVDDLVQSLAAEFNGARPVYADASGAAAYDEARSARDWWRKQFDERNLDPVKMTDDQWRQFYDDLNGAATDQAMTSDDLGSIPQQGALMGPFQSTIMALRDRYFGDGAVEAPSYVRSFFDDVLNADEVGLKTLEGWERRALDMASKAPDKQTAAFMQSVSKAIGARAASEGGPERRAALDAARTVRREQGETFEAGNVGKALEREDYGRYRVPDSNVGATLVPQGRTGGEAVDQLVSAAGPQDAEALVRSEVRRALDQAGTDPAAVQRVAGKYREAINRLPGLSADVRNARSAAVLQRAFTRSTLGKLRGDGQDPNATVARLITAQDAGKSLRRFGDEISGSPAATEGLRRSIANWISGTAKTSQVTDDLQTVPSTPKMIGSIERVLKATKGSQILTSDQRAVLNSLRRELRHDQFARSSNRTSGSDTMRNVDTQLGIMRLAAMLPGGDQAKSVLDVILTVAGRTDMLRDTLAEAMVDPKFAAQLLREQHPQRLENALRRIKSLNVGATTGSTATIPEE